jgi:hypothetical protein
MKIISFVRRKSLTIVNAVTEKEEHLRTASHWECKHCDKEKCAENCAHPANNNPGHHQAPIALKRNEGGAFKNCRFLTDGVLATVTAPIRSKRGKIRGTRKIRKSTPIKENNCESSTANT